MWGRARLNGVILPRFEQLGIDCAYKILEAALVGVQHVGQKTAALIVDCNVTNLGTPSCGSLCFVVLLSQCSRTELRTFTNGDRWPISTCCHG